MKDEQSKVYYISDLVFNFLNYAISLECGSLQQDKFLNALYNTNKYVEANQQKVCTGSPYIKINILANYDLDNKGNVKYCDATRALLSFAKKEYVKVLENDNKTTYIISGITPKQGKEYVKTLDKAKMCINEVLYKEYKKQLDLGDNAHIFQK